MHLGLAAEAVLNPASMDEVVSGVWSVFDALPLTHDKMFEACLAVGAFAVWGVLFESLHIFPSLNERRLDGKPPLGALRAYWADWHKTVVPAVTYLASIWLFHYFHLGQMLFPPAPAFEAPSYARVVIEVVLGIFLYDLFIYPFHMSFHRFGPTAWRQQHAPHHDWARTTGAAHNAVETVQHSYLDGGIQVAINILVQHISPWGFKHPLSRALHNMTVTYLLVEAHSGYDLPFMSHRLFPGIFGGPVRHEAHHQKGNVYFHQIFTYLDDAFGFVERSDPAPLEPSTPESAAPGGSAAP